MEVAAGVGLDVVTVGDDEGGGDLRRRRWR